MKRKNVSLGGARTQENDYFCPAQYSKIHFPYNEFILLMNGFFNSCSLWKAGKVHLMVWLHSEAWLGEPMLHMIRAKDVATYHVGGRSLTTLIKFCKLLTTCLPIHGWHWGKNSFTFSQGKSAYRWLFQYLSTSSCQRSLRTTPCYLVSDSVESLYCRSSCWQYLELWEIAWLLYCLLLLAGK